jgi:methyl-accepting chemotaxis protein
LSVGADRIGDVVMLIRDIAEQTNLLALNCHHRGSARGRGRPRVRGGRGRSEGPGQPDAGATEDIANQVGSIQHSTRDAVEAIRSISGVMSDH